jgi:hypothetical protein
VSRRRPKIRSRRERRTALALPTRTPSDRPVMGVRQRTGGRPVAAPGRARRREGGVRRWRGAHERHTPETAVFGPTGTCTCARGAPMAHPGRGTDRTRARCRARRLKPPAPTWGPCRRRASVSSTLRHGVRSSRCRRHADAPRRSPEPTPRVVYAGGSGSARPAGAHTGQGPRLRSDLRGADRATWRGSPRCPRGRCFPDRNSSPRSAPGHLVRASVPASLGCQRLR